MPKYLLLLSTFALASPALAQTAANDGGADSSVDAGDIVVTASGVAQPADQVGQAITVITRDEIDHAVDALAEAVNG